MMKYTFPVTHAPLFRLNLLNAKVALLAFTKHVGHALTLNVLSNDTRRVLPRSLIRRCDQKNRLLDPDPPSQYPLVIRSLSDDALPEGSDILPTLPTLEPIDADALYDQIQDDYEAKSKSHAKSDQATTTSTDGEPILDTEDGEPTPNDDGEYEERVDLTCTVLMPPDQYGQRFRAKIIERVDDYHKGLDNEREKNPKYKVLVGHDGGEPWEEIVVYNDLCNLIHDDDATDGIWQFRKILSHHGPINSKDPMHKGSRYNVLIEWETGEVTMEPLKNVQHDKAVCGTYARKSGLLDTPGWKQFRKHAHREQKLLRLVNQAKLHSFRTAPVYKHRHLVPQQS